MSLCGPTRSAYVKYAGGAEPRLRCGAHGARTGELRCLGHRRNLLRPAWHLFAAGMRSERPAEGRRRPQALVPAGSTPPLAPTAVPPGAVGPTSVVSADRP